MQGWRKNSCPRVPKTIQEYVQLLNSQRWRSRFFSNDSNLDVSNIIGTDGSVATVFIDGIMLQNFTNVNLYVDATYKVCPRQPNKKIYQFFTIMASFDDTVLPVAWSFKSHKSMPCYHSVMNRFQQLTPHLQVLSITTDFEVSLRNVLRELYPNAVLKGCYFHHVQALMKKAEKIKLLDVLNDWDDGQDFFRKLITLAFAFHAAFHQFLLYYESYWLKVIKPENFSVFGCRDKTNNYVEANNRRLNMKFGVHLSIWNSTEKPMALYQKSKTEL
ncbi:Protein of unknown function [Cotesia congregata]|uniref:MULE transposase domain-containing protein n=1 Tax=Cotesia congregata TaxID=51543 RepID=A0A8J2EK12_COTCN|nr:Protein of unknown function [Cotesia congregata]